MDELKYVSAPKVLLYGTPGSGKTYSISTLLEAGMEVFVLGLEVGFEQTILQAVQDKGLPYDKLHYSIIEHKTMGWDKLEKAATQMQSMSHEELIKVGFRPKGTLSATKTYIDNAGFKTYSKLLKQCHNFQDVITGKEYGSISNFKSNQVVVLDSLSALNDAIMEHRYATKLALTQSDWQPIVKMQKMFLDNLVNGTEAMVVVLGHMQAIKDELTKAEKISISMIGQKLSQEMPRIFTDIIFTENDNGRFRWNTKVTKIITKSRNLPIASTLEPSFVPLIETVIGRDKDILKQQKKGEATSNT